MILSFAAQLRQLARAKRGAAARQLGQQERPRAR
jgi:hypothetical protein